MAANSVYHSNILELIALLESDIDSQLELKKATYNAGSILCTCKDIIHFLRFLIFGFITQSHIEVSCIL